MPEPAFQALNTSPQRGSSSTDQFSAPESTNAVGLTLVRTPIATLEAAYRELLGDGFGDSVRGLCWGQEWYQHQLSDSEVFRFWVYDQFQSPSRVWVFAPIRGSERSRLCALIGITTFEREGSTQEALGERILNVIGLPVIKEGGSMADITHWESLIRLIDQSQDEKASVKMRAASERLLKKILWYACNAGADKIFLEVLRAPGSIRIPKSLLSHVEKPDPSALHGLFAALQSDKSKLDLGFLILILARLDSRLGREKIGHALGSTAIFTREDRSAFENLAVALQAYAHDKPTEAQARKSKLRDTAVEVLASVGRMGQAKTIPDEGVVIQVGVSVFGEFFSVHNGIYSRVLLGNPLPELGKRILFLSEADRDFSQARWVANPW